jgi:hypothetical protein
MSCSSRRPSSRVYSLCLIQCTLCHTEILSTKRMFECCTPTAKNTQVRESYGNQTASQQYQAFLQTGVEVQGVYDDHDFGVNDVGSELGEHRERMDAFLDFIGASATDPRRTQEAIYSSHVYGPPHKQVKVCVLQCYHIAFAHCLLSCSSLAHTGESYIQNLYSKGCVCM